MTMTPTKPRDCKYCEEGINGAKRCRIYNWCMCGICHRFTPKSEKMEIDDKLKGEHHLHTLAMEEQQKAKASLLGESDYFNRILEMNTEAERRRFAAQIMASMMQNAKWGDKYRHIASMAVTAADALIVELNKKKE